MVQDPLDHAFQLFRGPFFRLAYPQDWEMEIIEDVPAFYDPEGAGALQVIASRSPTGSYDLDEELQRWLERQALQLPDDRIVRYEVDGVSCAACEFMREGRFWMLQLMTSGPSLLLVLYNADEVPDAATAGLLSTIIRSIHIEEATA